MNDDFLDCPEKKRGGQKDGVEGEEPLPEEKLLRQQSIKQYGNCRREEGPGHKLDRITARIALVEAQPLARAILTQWLKDLGSNSTITHYADETGLIADAGYDKRYDLVVVRCDWLGLGVRLEGCFETIARIVAALPTTPVVVVSDVEHWAAICWALKQGARGYIPTTLELPLTIAALRLILLGGIFAPAMPLFERVAADLVVGTDIDAGEDSQAIEIPNDKDPESAADAHSSELPMLFDAPALQRLGITVREAKVLLLLQKGKTNRQIAAELGISENTVIVHVRHVMRKVGATNRTQAVFQALRLLEQVPLGSERAN